MMHLLSGEGQKGNSAFNGLNGFHKRKLTGELFLQILKRKEVKQDANYST
jgi:hypothetical protein